MEGTSKHREVGEICCVVQKIFCILPVILFRHFKAFFSMTWNDTAVPLKLQHHFRIQQVVFFLWTQLSLTAAGYHLFLRASLRDFFFIFFFFPQSNLNTLHLNKEQRGSARCSLPLTRLFRFRFRSLLPRRRRSRGKKWSWSF